MNDPQPTLTFEHEDDLVRWAKSSAVIGRTYTATLKGQPVTIRSTLGNRFTQGRVYVTPVKREVTETK